MARDRHGLSVSAAGAAPVDRSGRARVFAYIVMPIVALLGIGFLVLGASTAVFLVAGATLLVLAILGLIAARGARAGRLGALVVAAVGIVVTLIVGVSTTSATGDTELMSAAALAFSIAAAALAVFLIGQAAATRRG